MVDSLLIKNVLHDNAQVDILIENGYFTQIEPLITIESDIVIDGSNQSILPPFYNGHTHVAMTLLRGYADGYELMDWLQKVWSLEQKLSPEDMYASARLACLEMIKSGTVFFADMYWGEGALNAAIDMGLRVSVGPVFHEYISNQMTSELDQYAAYFFNRELPNTITPTLCPHSIYTVSREKLEWVVLKQIEQDCFIHIHVAETLHEVNECQKKHGCTPIEYLDQIGILGPKTIAAHCTHLTQNDIQILALRGVSVVHNPVSNLKLGSGSMDYKQLEEAGVRICLGTDSVASNNNLSMFDEMKFASLIAKQQSSLTSIAGHDAIFNCATKNGARAFGINSGEIKVGLEADCMLVNLNDSRLVPNHNLISNIVYSADSSCIETVICRGNILMNNRVVENEQDIIKAAKHTFPKIIRR